MSQLEQCCIVKANSTCVVGSAKAGFQWDNLVVDYLLSKLLSSHRYKKVLCLNADRNSRDLCEIGRKHADKLVFLQTELFDSDQYLDSVIDEIRHRIIADKLIDSFTSYALVIYSFSELMWQFGNNAALEFLQRLQDMLYPNHASQRADHDTSINRNSKSSAKSELAVSNNPAFVFTVHESLHSQSTLTKIQSLVPIVVKVLPNSGTLSAEVVCEIQTMRKSPNTGKIAEGVEMFGFRKALLYPLLAHRDNLISSEVSAREVSSASGKTPEEPSDTTESDSAKENLLETRLQGMNLNSSSTTGLNATTNSTITTTTAASNNSAPNLATARLITFDSTDPEFDEDSDPDADLDL